MRKCNESDALTLLDMFFQEELFLDDTDYVLNDDAEYDVELPEQFFARSRFADKADISTAHLSNDGGDYLITLATYGDRVLAGAMKDLDSRKVVRFMGGLERNMEGISKFLCCEDNKMNGRRLYESVCCEDDEDFSDVEVVDATEEDELEDTLVLNDDEIDVVEVVDGTDEEAVDGSDDDEEVINDADEVIDGSDDEVEEEVVVCEDNDLTIDDTEEDDEEIEVVYDDDESDNDLVVVDDDDEEDVDDNLEENDDDEVVDEVIDDDEVVDNEDVKDDDLEEEDGEDDSMVSLVTYVAERSCKRV